MGLYKRGRVWWIAHTPEGRLVRKSTGQTNKSKAEDVWIRLKASTLDGTYVPERKRPGVLDSPPFEVAVESYLDLRIREGKQERSYEYLRDPWARIFKGRQVDEVTAEEVESVLRSEQEKRNWTNASRNNALAQMSGLLGYAMRKRWIDAHPTQGRVSLLPVDNGRVRWLRQHERESIKASGPNATNDDSQCKRQLLADGLDFLCATGLRKGVTFNLRKSDVEVDDEGNAYVIVERDKNGERFYKRVVGSTREIVERRAGEAPFPHSYLFAGPKGGNAESTFLRLFRDAVKKAKLEWGRYKKVEGKRVPNPNGITIHTCRHTFASAAINSGIGEAEVQAMGNWKSRRMVSRYSHLAPENLQAAEEKLDEALNATSQCFTLRKSAGQAKSETA